MKKNIISLIIIFLLAAVLPEAKSEPQMNSSSTGVFHFLPGSDNAAAADIRIKKRKIKKVVRKIARVYRRGKTDRSKIKKSRKIQRQARRIINVF